jgi:hypothetical protein
MKGENKIFTMGIAFGRSRNHPDYCYNYDATVYIIS